MQPMRRTRFPSQWIENLRNQADLVAIVSRVTPLSRKGRKHWGLCPFHQEKTASFTVDSEQGLYYCFGCKAGGTVFNFLMETERLSFSEAVVALAEDLRVPIPEGEPQENAIERRTQREMILEVNRKAALFYHQKLYENAGAEALSYLHNRGLDDKVIRSFGLGCAPPGWQELTDALTAQGHGIEQLTMAGLTIVKGDKRFDMFRNRAMFPILGGRSEVLGFGGRALGDQQPKYLNTAETPAFNKRLGVYALDRLRKSRGLLRVLLVEGYMDVLSLTAQGIEGVVATLGTSLTPEQAKLLGRYAPEVWVCYDGDAAGQTATLRALDILGGQSVLCKVIVIPDGMDPDDYVRAKGREAFEKLPVMDAPRYRLLRAKEGFDLSTEDGRVGYAMAAAAILRTVVDPVRREPLLKALVMETGFAMDVLKQQIGAISSDSVVKTPYMQRPTGENREDFKDFPDSARAQTMLLALLASRLVPAGAIEPDVFENPLAGQVAAMLLSGQPVVELADQCEDDPVRAMLLEAVSTELSMDSEAAMHATSDCLSTIRRQQIERRIRTLRQELPNHPNKAQALQEITRLMQDLQPLRLGRKE